MSNVHYFLPPNSLSFPPLVRRLAHFIAKDISSNLNTEEALAFLRYGESYSFEKRQEKEFSKCPTLSIAKCRSFNMQP